MKLDFDVKKTLDCDVLVIGGGIAGVAAAVSSARCGANVILAEAMYNLGGTAVTGLVGPFMTCSDAKGEKQIITGFYKEIMDRMIEQGGAIDPMTCDAGTSYSGYYRKGHKNCGPFSSECLKITAEEMCIEAGVKIMYNLNLIKLLKEGKKINSAVFSSKCDIYVINAKTFVDCTGDANGAYMAGVPFQNEEGEELQATSLFFEIEGIDKEVYDEYCKSKMDVVGDDHFDKVIAEERALGNYNTERPRMGTYEAADGSWKVNGTRMCNIDATDNEEVTKALIAGRKQIYDILSLLKRRIPGCENVRLKTSASMLGIRETRRIKGEYILSTDDLVKGTEFEDAIFRCSSSIDFHSNTSGRYIANESDSYTVPYRVLLPQEVDNLIVAGRSISADKFALSAIRVMPPCFAMGQAAGVASALASRDGKSFSEIDIKELQKVLKEQNVNL